MSTLPSIPNLITQSFPPTPKFTSAQCPDLTGRVFLITGGTSGLGLELCRILYSKNGNVYITGRASSSTKAEEIISELKITFTGSKGKVVFLAMDMLDLREVKPAVERFLKAEKSLDALWNNAGVMGPPVGERSVQNHDPQLAIHCLAHMLLTQLLLPILHETAKDAPPASVRVIWLSTVAIESFAPAGGIDLSSLDHEEERELKPLVRYAQSKVGAYFLSCEFARAEKEREKNGERWVVSLCINPGNLMTGLQRHQSKLMNAMLWKRINKPSINGAYTELFAGLSTEVTMAQNGGYIIPFGRIPEKAAVRGDIIHAAMSKNEGGLGKAEEFVAWCDERVKEFR